MLIEMLMALGLVTSFQQGDLCIDALHELRVMEGMRIESTAVLEDNVIAFTLTDSPRISSKTAILVCRRDVEEEEVVDEGEEQDEAFDDVEQEEDLDDIDEESEPAAEDDEEAAQ